MRQDGARAGGTVRLLAVTMAMVVMMMMVVVVDA